MIFICALPIIFLLSDKKMVSASEARLIVKETSLCWLYEAGLIRKD
jgi:hypothetical protein